jgi:hypothetical protein
VPKKNYPKLLLVVFGNGCGSVRGRPVSEPAISKIEPPSPRLLGGCELESTAMKLKVLTIILVFLMAGEALGRDKEFHPDCPPADVSVTSPAPANIPELVKSLIHAKDDQGNPAFIISKEMKKEMNEVFNPPFRTTKMAQFYGALFVLQKHSKIKRLGEKIIPGKEIQKALIHAGVFPDNTFPKIVSKVVMVRGRYNQPGYRVEFTRDSLEIPLNQGKGFRSWDNGMCQHAKALYFKSPFTFWLRKKGKNLKAYDFENVDLRGDLGTRGIIDLDLNYVSLKAVEFIHGTVLGKVTAKVSDKEFEVNDHHWILRIITSIVSDTTTQAIDW